MKCVIIQPSYIPWRGYFDQVCQADLFLFYDDVQYGKHSWRNRNRIKTSQGLRWLTIPVENQNGPINQVTIDWKQNWNKKHWMTLQQSYCRAPYFDRYAELLEEFYNRKTELLADFAIDLTIALARELGCTKTRFVRSSTLQVTGSKTDRLIQILTQLGANEYLTGPSARDYIEEDKFEAARIRLEYMRYDYPEYAQLYPPFESQVSILDLLFMTGPEAPRFMEHTSIKAEV
jgi:hypothetical protein